MTQSRMDHVITRSYRLAREPLGPRFFAEAVVTRRECDLGKTHVVLVELSSSFETQN